VESTAFHPEEAPDRIAAGRPGSDVPRRAESLTGSRDRDQDRDGGGPAPDGSGP
jgi:hypothetical protein